MEVDPIAVALEVAAALERTGVRYVIGGSVASTLYGEPRATMDVDFAVQLDTARVAPLASSLEASFYVDRPSMLEAAEHHRLCNIIHRQRMLKVDLHVRPPEGIFAEEIRRALRLRLRTNPEGFANVASPEDTLLQKLRWYQLGNQVSDRQWRDVLGILKTVGDDLDHEYLERWAGKLSLRPLLARASDEARGGPR